jgi:predicted amidohydrolase YtcJ
VSCSKSDAPAAEAFAECINADLVLHNTKIYTANDAQWTDEKRFLTKHDVDAFTINKPLFMPRADGVSALVNSKALELAGISKDTLDPLSGKFERDALRKGIQIQTHVIGDRAVRALFDWYEEAFNTVPKSEWAVADPNCKRKDYLSKIVMI